MMKILVVGFGQFGRFVHHYLTKSGFGVSVSSMNSLSSEKVDKYIENYESEYGQKLKLDDFVEYEKALETAELVVPCVPIRNFEEFVISLKNNSYKGKLVEVCSIKKYPENIIRKHLDLKMVKSVITHPMFGPNSYSKNNDSIKDFRFVIQNVNFTDGEYQTLISWLESQELNVVQITSDEHDQMAAKSQFISLYFASIFQSLELKSSSINTPSFDYLLEYVDRVGDDIGIVKDMVKYNPYCKAEMRRIKSSLEEVDVNLN